MYYVYIIETASGTYYTGQTNDLRRRISEHVAGNSKSALYFRIHPPKYLVYTESFDSRSEAIQKELEIKRNQRFKLSLIGERIDLGDFMEA